MKFVIILLKITLVLPVNFLILFGKSVKLGYQLKPGHFGGEKVLGFRF